MARIRSGSSSYGTWRGRPRLRLMGARRGDGAVVWSGMAIPAAYELDLFSSGTMFSVQGNLEGDLSRLMSEDRTRLTQAGGVRLRLDDGQEIDIDLLELEPWFAEFSAVGTSASADLLATATSRRTPFQA